jgi:hypothetical protein
MTPQPLQSVPNYLTIKERGKSIPYGPAPRANGDTNHGFMNLKSDPAAIASVPELASDPALRALVASINAPHTSLFSAGCVSGHTVQDDMHGYCGYLEFAWNSVHLVQDAQSYFPLFFWFNKLLVTHQFVRAKFEWELQGAHFLARNVGGFTCTIFINTTFSPTQDEALADWNTALGYLTSYVGTVNSGPTDHIYQPA